MDDPEGVAVSEGARDLSHDLERVGGRERALAPDPVAEGLPLDPLHDQVGLPPFAAIVVDPDHVGVLNASQAQGLALEARQALGLEVEEELERDLGPVGSAGPKHSPLPAASHLTQELIAAHEAL